MVADLSGQCDSLAPRLRSSVSAIAFVISSSVADAEWLVSSRPTDLACIVSTPLDTHACQLMLLFLRSNHGHRGRRSVYETPPSGSGLLLQPSLHQKVALAGAGSFIPPCLPARCLDRRGSHALSDQLPVSDRLPMAAQDSSHLISFSCPATPDTSSSGRGEPCSRAQDARSSGSQTFYQHASPQPAGTGGSIDPSQASSSARLTAAAHGRTESDSEDEMRYARSPGDRASHHVNGCMGRQPSWRGAAQHEHAGQHSTLERQLSHDHSGYCQRCGSGSLDRRPSRELIGARRPSRHTQDSLAGLLGQQKDHLATLPPSPFSILHQPQQELLRSPSSSDEVSQS